MSASLVDYLIECGGEPMCPPMQHNTKDRFDVIEIWVDAGTNHVHNQVLRQISLDMLRYEMNTKANIDRGFVVRIVCIPLLVSQKWYQVDLQRELYDELLETLGLSNLRRLAHTSPMTFDVIPQQSGDKIVGVDYSAFVSNYLGLYFSYKESGTANGVIWCLDDSAKVHRMMMNSLLTAHSKFAHLGQDPFYLLFATILGLLSSVDRRLTRTRAKVNSVELDTGYQDWGDLRLVDGLPNSSIEPDLARYAAEMSGLETTLASDRRFIQMAFAMLNTIMQDRWLDNLVPANSGQPLQVQMKDDLEVLQSRLSNHLVQIQVLEARVRNQRSAVDNLITRREMQLSIGIAGSMKILAVVTVLFLPATFIASLFSTTMFNWHITPEQSVSPQFWIYWVVAIPLTAVTIGLFFFLSNRRARPSGQVGDEEVVPLTSNGLSMDEMKLS